MKPSLPPDNIPDGTPWERMNYAFRKVITVPKEAVAKPQAKPDKQKKRKRKTA